MKILFEHEDGPPTLTHKNYSIDIKLYNVNDYTYIVKRMYASHICLGLYNIIHYLKNKTKTSNMFFTNFCVI